MTTYEKLAIALTAGGIKADTAKAYRLAMAAWRGEPMTDKEAGLVAAWEAREAAEPWAPETARQRG